MTILFTGRKAHLSSDLKAFAHGKLGKLEKYLGDILDAHVILSREKNRQVAEVVVKAGSRTLTAKAEAAEFTEAIAVCADRILTQARKVRGRRTARRKGRGAWTGPGKESIGDLVEAARNSVGVVPEVVRMGRITVRSMTVREAVLRAQDAERPVLVFRDLASQQMVVIFRRPDGQFGLLETES